MKENQKTMNIDLIKIIKKLIAKKLYFIIVLPIVFFFSCLYIYNVPRYYTCNIKLAPEYGSTGGSSVSDLASSFGINLGKNQSLDAFSPTLYPDLITGPDFIVKLFSITVERQDGKLKTNYFDYIANNQLSNPLSDWIFKKKHLDSTLSRINSFRLTKDQSKIAESIKKNIACVVDRKTDVITITVTDQDPYIAACLCDSIKGRLQSFITDYRTKKSRKDVTYYQKLADDAKAQYESARQKYASYSDANQDVILKSVESRIEALENDMQLKYNNYQTNTAQLLAAKAKVQQNTPAFTILQSASVPTKPAGPKRMIFVISMMFIAFVITSVVILRKDMKKILA